MSNTLVVHVVRAKELRLRKHKELEVYVSLSTTGSSKWKSKVSTNSVKTTDGNCEFGEHCEFQLADGDVELHISVNYKTVLGTTESLGQFVFVLEQMARYQPPTWFRLFKKNKNDAKDYGFIQLEYQFSNKMSSSVSSFSLNKVEKEKKFEKLKRKMMLIGKSKKATADDQSMVSISLSRKSSFSSNASALAFSSPSPNHMAMAMNGNGPVMLTCPENQINTTNSLDLDTLSTTGNIADNRSADVTFRTANESLTQKRDSMLRNEKTFSKEFNNDELDTMMVNQNATDTPKNITSKVRHRAEQILNLRHRKQASDQTDESVDGNSLRVKSNGGEILNGSRPSSIASSSGFASLGSNTLGALNENTSTEHLLSVIKHLRNEILARDNRIRDLEEYTDKLLSKIIVYYPDLLQVSTNSTARR